MRKLRLIFDKKRPGPENMGLDYALLRSLSAGAPDPVLRVYGWSDPTITIGYFQSLADETDAEACAQYGVSTIRRITGGGAVFHEHEVTYSIVIPLDGGYFPYPVIDSYAFILAPIVDTLRTFGLDALHAPINDILIHGKKISGSAQTRRRGVLLQHGTILLDIDKDKVFSCLTVPSAKTAAHGISDPSSRITTLRELTGDKALTPAFAVSLIKGIVERFAHALELRSYQSEFTDSEIGIAEEAVHELFGNPAWNTDRTRTYEI
jgi:lipoate-protein ligase A